MKLNEALSFIREDKKVEVEDKKLKDLFDKTFAILQRIINKQVLESYLEEAKGKELGKYNVKSSKALSKAEAKALALPDKRKLLKKIYTQTLTNMGMERNIKIFNKIIDIVPEKYLDYELQIDTASAGEFVKDLIDGKGQIADNELGNIINVVKGVGVPAIIHHATGEEDLPSEIGTFGAEGINKNVKDYLDSKRRRNNPTFQLDGPKSKEIAVISKDLEEIKRGVLMTINQESSGLRKFRNSNIGKLAASIRGSGMNIEGRLDNIAKTIKQSKDYKEANSLFKKGNVELEFQNQSEYNSFLSNILNKEKVKEKVPRWAFLKSWKVI